MNSALVTRSLSLEAAAYIAGLIDGEGTITLSRLHANENRRLVISIANTEIQLLEYVLCSAGVGKITRKRKTSEAHTQSFCYSVTSQQALALLKQITPFLKSYKRGRALLALDRYQALTPRNGRYSRAQVAERQEFESTFLSLVPTGKPSGVRDSADVDYALNHQARNSSMLM